LFCAHSLPHFIWLFSTYFYYTEKQQQKIEHVYLTGIRMVYSLWGYDDLTTLTLSREYTLRDYLCRYWVRFQKHLDVSPEANSYRQTWTAYLIATAPSGLYYRSCGFRRNAVFPNRLSQRAHHTYLDLMSFMNVQREQLFFFKKSFSHLEHFVLKYFPMYPP